MKTRCIIGKIWELSSYLDKQVKMKIKEANLPILRNHMPLFYILPDTGAPIRFNELASKWNISKSSLSDIITKYEALGLINKCECVADKRNLYLSLTEEAIVLRSRLHQLEDDILSECFGDFTEEEQAVLSKMIDRVLTCNCTE